MATFSPVAGSTLTPDISSGLGALLGAFGTKQSRSAEELERQKKIDIQKEVDVLSGQTALTSPEEQEAALVRLSALNPQVATSIRASLERGDKLDIQIAAQETEKGVRQAVLIQQQPDFASKQRALSEAAQLASSKGEDVSRFVELSNLSEPQLDLELQKMVIQGADLKTLTDAALEVPDVAAAGGEIVKSSEISDGFVVRRQPDGSFTKTKVLESATVAESGKASAVTKIFDNGTTIQALPNGKTVVKGPGGEVVTGDERVAMLKQAREEQIEFAQTKAGATAAGGAAISQSTKAFEKIGTIKTSIANIDQAINLLDEGAKTGPIVSKLPSIRASSVALDNVQKAMGLDVIGDTTFGALSKGELDLALSKALPTGLKPEALREWLVEKKSAQEKLSTYLEDVAIFLGTPGNTVAGWLDAQRAITGQPGSGGTPEPIEVDF